MALSNLALANRGENPKLPGPVRQQQGGIAMPAPYETHRAQLKAILSAWGMPEENADATADNLGGPIVTATNLVFIAAALADKLRAFDVRAGRELWQGPLPAGGPATPMTYVAGGRQ
jgi:hypothetical protein